MRKFLLRMLVASMCFLTVAAVSGCDKAPEGNDNTTETPVPTEASTPTEAPTPTKKPTPSMLLLTDDTTEIVPQKLEVTATSDIFTADFEDGNIPEWISGDGQVVDSNLMNGAKALQMNGGKIRINPQITLDDEVAALKFKVKITELPESLQADNDFLTNNELLHVRAGEAGRIDAGNPYSAKFRMIQKTAKTGFLAGKTTDTNAVTDFVLKGANDCVYGMLGTYDITLYFTKDRCYIEVNDGAGHVSYGNARTVTNDFVFAVRDGVTVLFDDISYFSAKLPVYEADASVKRFVDEGLFTNYLYSHNSIDGVEFERISNAARISYGNSSTTNFNSGLSIDMFSNTKYIAVTFKNIESSYGVNYPLTVDVFLNGVRETEIQTLASRVGHDYTIAYKLPSDAAEYNRITLQFAANMSIAVKKIKIDEGAVTAPVPKDGTIVVLGDSITEGAECYRPADVWAAVVAEKYNFRMLNQAVAGWSFAGYNVEGDYGDIKPDYVLVANGTNNFASGHETAEAKRGPITSSMKAMIDNIHTIFPETKIYGITPIWRNDENGPKCTLLEVSDIIKEVYGEYDDITVIDGYNLVPHEEAFFSNPTLALHATYAGHAVYGENMVKELMNLIGAPKEHDWVAEAAAAFGK